MGGSDSLKLGPMGGLSLGLQAMGVSACLLDVEGRILAVNRAFEQLLGPTSAQTEGQRLSHCLNWSAAAEQLLAEALATDGAAVPGESTGRDGTVRWMLWEIRRLSGDEPRWLATGVDHTAWRAAEAAQRLNESRLEALLALHEMTQATLAEITEFTLEEAVRLTGSTIGYIGFTNTDESRLKLHSWSKGAMAECHLDNPEVDFTLEEIGLLGEPIRQRQPVVTNDYAADNPLKHGLPPGHVGIVRHLAVPVFHHERIVAVAGVANKPENYDESDLRQLQLLTSGMWRLAWRRQLEASLVQQKDQLTERVRQRTEELQEANQALATEMMERERAAADCEQAEGLYRSLFDLSPDGILLVDPESQRLLDFNRAACEQFGRSPAEMRQLRIIDFQAEMSPEEINERIEYMLAHGRQDMETKHRTKAGEVRDILVTIQPLSIAGRTVLHAVCRDVTDRKRADEDRRRAEQLERRLLRTTAMQSLGQLTAGIAHDFRNLLAAIGALAAATQTAGGGDEVIAECAEGITEAVQQGSGLVRQLLEFSRHEPGRQEPTNVNQVVLAVEKLVAKTLGPEIESDLSLAPALPAVVADPVQIQQVLLNLAVNARDAMPRGGTLRVSTRLLSAEEVSAIVAGPPCADKYVSLSVSDTGTGIPAELVQRIFEPHFSTKLGGDSAGLGLATVQDIARRHNGHVTVQSQEGCGSTFTVLFPVLAAR